MRGLRKVFGTQGSESAVVAVKGTDLDIFEGQILSLLGHNGAGKTTSINMCAFLRKFYVSMLFMMTLCVTCAFFPKFYVSTLFMTTL